MTSRSILSLKRPGAADAPTLDERLHKVLANAGLGSRRLLLLLLQALQHVAEIFLEDAFLDA